jgi:NAD(P)-dependent dehydrogenase (short-subunit alcohol dehydrogenase family)
MIIAIVPIKYISTRIPGKNYRKMDGKPLYWYIFNILFQISQIDMIICNTDSLEIEKMINNDFPNVVIYHRPKHLEGGHISTNLILLDTIEKLKLTDENNLFIQTHVTNPLLSVETVNKCIQSYFENTNDSLFTVKQLQTRLYDKTNHAINHDPNNLIPTQDLDPIYEENSCLYIFSYKVIKNINRIGENPFLFIMNDIESSDIDYETDFILTEQLIKLKKKSSQKVVLVTGNSGGIGSSIADYFHKKNWIVIGLDLIYKNNVDLFFQFDLTKNNNFDSCISSVIKEYGRIDCLVNNAALQICKSWEEYNEIDWQNTFNCNLKSCYELSKNCRKFLKKTKGSIINICSIHCLTTSKNIGLYAISKSALQGLTKSMSLEYIEDGINVNCILPGAIQTPMLQKSMERTETPEKALEKLKKTTPFGDIGDPKEIAKAVYFLYKSKFSVGSSLVIDGGVSIKLSSE